MASSSVSRADQIPYQGYPYVKPVVIDAPSIDAATAARWANLPRKPISNPTQRRETTSSEAGSSQANAEGTPRLKESTEQSKTAEEDVPVIYVPLPDEGECCGSGIAITQQQDGSGEENPAFIEETIFYDPFENRQIEINRTKELIVTEETSPGPGSAGPSRVAPPAPSPVSNTRPNGLTPPSSVNLYSPVSPAPISSSNIPPYQPDFMNRETQLYGRPVSADDGFNLSPLPVNNYPTPPPAYSEVDTVATNPPRTQVVVVRPDERRPTVGLPSANRKLVFCQDCGLRVHTMVVQENGVITHFIAFITVLLCIFPLTAVVYCNNIFKYQVHYCPNCNFKIGYEVPLLCQSMVYNRK